MNEVPPGDSYLTWGYPRSRGAENEARGARSRTSSRRNRTSAQALLLLLRAHIRGPGHGMQTAPDLVVEADGHRPRLAGRDQIAQDAVGGMLLHDAHVAIREQIVL